MCNASSADNLPHCASAGPDEVCTLIDGSVDAREITSVLVDHGERGYVKIAETQQREALKGAIDDWFGTHRERSLQWCA